MIGANQRPRLAFAGKERGNAPKELELCTDTNTRGEKQRAGAQDTARSKGKKQARAEGLLRERLKKSSLLKGMAKKSGSGK